jgi:glycine/D-amino acid oxidase-like deaminating enzyme
MRKHFGRREVMLGAGAALLAGALPGCSTTSTPRALHAGTAGTQGGPVLPPLPAPRASVDRITRISVCTRPFRAAGPRLDVERIGARTVVHNYGHGGSGWSLSWGSSAIATQKALATGEHDFAVIGCGALGLTSALLLQRAGARVTIYAKDLPPNVRSSLATGVWSPDSRVCMEAMATPEFRRLWEGMARQSFQTYQTLLGLPGNPVEFYDNYVITGEPLTASASAARTAAQADRPQFAELQSDLVADLIPAPHDFRPGQHQFGARYVRQHTLMMFNLSAYQRMLVDDFLLHGGRIEVREFHTPQELTQVPQRTLINATGYGARALLGDESVTPVRGQLARVIPQPDINYGLYYHKVSFVPRRDGLVFQCTGDDDYYGFGDETAVPDRAEAELAVNTIAGLFTAG